MQKIFARAIRITTLLFVLTAALFLCGFLSSGTAVASATTTYELGENVVTPIGLTYGTAPADLILPVPWTENAYFKIISYDAFKSAGDAPFPLVEEGRVTAQPGTYHMHALNNAVPCDANGEVIPDAECSGTLTIIVEKNRLNVSLPAASLTKEYGVSAEKPSLTDGDLVVNFETAGRAATADVGTGYPLTDCTVTLGGVDRTEYYIVTAKIAETNETATYTVTPKAVVFEYEKTDEVRFNDYLLPDGTSVTAREVAGANGDTLTAYFRMKEEVTGVLTVGTTYEIELYRYEVRPAEGEAQSFGAEEVSNYEISALYTANSVRAKVGSVIVYQDESLIAARQNDSRFLYLPVSAFTYTYLDLICTDLGEVMNAGGVLYPTVTFYPGVTGTLRFSVEGVQEGNIPVGSYPMTYLGHDCSEIETLSFDDLSLTVVPLYLPAYSEKKQVEITLSNEATDNFSRTHKDVTYSFRVRADLTGRGVGEEVAYTILESLSDPNVLVEFAEARVRVVKRRTGVSLRAESEKSLSFGVPAGALAEPYLEETLLESEGANVHYRYRATNGTVDFEGIPTAVGSYVVTCSLSSDLYETAPVEVSLTVVKRRVAALYHVSVTQKTYGETFAYRVSDRTVSITELYPLDSSDNADRTQKLDFKASDFSGTVLSSEGGAASASVGTYPFVTSGAVSPSYVIVKAFVFDVGTEREVTAFTVNKAPSAPAPTPEYQVTKNREIKVTVSGRFNAQISRNVNMSSPTEANGEGSVTVQKIGGKKPLFGEVFYLRVRAEANENYENAGAWSDVMRVEIPFAAPSVSVSALAAGAAECTFMPLTDSTDGYRIQYRVGSSGEWKEGALDTDSFVKVTGLRADTAYTLYFRAEKEGVTGAASSIGIRTLRAAVEENQVKANYDWATKTLTVDPTVEGLEYCVCSSSGEVLMPWTSDPDFDKVILADNNYVLKVRYAEVEGESLSSEEREIAIDTHKPKEKVTWRTVLRDWFLAIVGGVLLLSAVLFIFVFTKKKKRIDREEA